MLNAKETGLIRQNEDVQAFGRGHGAQGGLSGLVRSERRAGRREEVKEWWLNPTILT